MTNKLKLRLTVDVTYDLNGERPETLRHLLEQIATHAAGEGRMSGHTTAEVDTWDVRVEEVLPHYALIDNASGYIWWDGTARTPEEACAKATLELQGVEAIYEATAELAGVDAGYHVYAAPDDFMVVDGQDQDNIDEVQDMPLVGMYRLA